ncbi:SprT-like family-domain-containing protein [Stachybotrys elegans]|uniref:SprT-like family-domain-containing protein n=1 Tax=Stachybotrys elegans TaxID=80388 RepID=A0A8K0SXL9_9HYPO|nr:SprT-like family-domain-containing protein [Stachybotrys elegans]
MARLTQRVVSSEDELPDIKTLVKKSAGPCKKAPANSNSGNTPKAQPASQSSKGSTVRKIRRLGSDGSQTPNNPLLQKWNGQQDDAISTKHAAAQTLSKAQRFQDWMESSPPPIARSTRTRRQRIAPELEDESDDDTAEDSHSDDSDEEETLQSRIRKLRDDKRTISQRKSENLGPDNMHNRPVTRERKQSGKGVNAKPTGQKVCVKEVGDLSESEGEFSSDSEADPSIYLTAGEDEFDDAASQLSDSFHLDSPARLRLGKMPRALPAVNMPRQSTRKTSLRSKKGVKEKHPPQSTDADLADTLSKLRLDFESPPHSMAAHDESDSTPSPPRTPSRTPQPKGLSSPRKVPRIPKTPHRPSMDVFWDQEFVNDWNDQHSPRKTLFAPRTPSPIKKDPPKSVKKSFNAGKHAMAERFLQELDKTIAQGKISQLAESTGGVKVIWSKTLNTTAGRANWRLVSGRQHHAHIELAEKVIDDEHRLLNVVAHEFCHLATFMIDGITNNPHGQHFKSWARKVSLEFADRGIQVTTKHSFAIDYKYIWQCVECFTEFKRHSKSIDPTRHRCGRCKNLLEQIKPKPRKAGQPSAYQTFVKENMAKVREENPGSPQKDLMKLVASKWAARNQVVGEMELV